MKTSKNRGTYYSPFTIQSDIFPYILKIGRLDCKLVNVVKKWYTSLDYIICIIT